MLLGGPCYCIVMIHDAVGSFESYNSMATLLFVSFVRTLKNRVMIRVHFRIRVRVGVRVRVRV